MSDYETIRYQRQGDIGTLTLARPAKRNAQNPLMWQELARLGAELLPDETLRCLVVAAEGPVFSAGIDLAEGMTGLLADWADRAGDERAMAEGMAAAGTFSWIPELGCASVAAVRGHAYGAGLQLALACDFRIFAEGTRVGLPETRFGLLPDMGATVRLPRIIGEARARELILLGEIIDADEALRIGEIAAEHLDVDGARQAIDAAWHCGPQESFRLALEAQLRCLKSEDFKEARQAMAEGRAPRWQGR